VSQDGEQIGWVASPRVIDAYVGILIVPPDATSYRASIVSVQLGSPLKTARLAPQPSWSLRGSSETVQRRPNAWATLPPVSTNGEGEPVASLCLQAVVRRLLRDRDK
jgi:hypothetical protein